jgi:hypothetical protein
MTDRSIWHDAPLAVYLTDDDFAAEFGRERTEAEAEAHEMFNDAASLAEPSTHLEAGR